MKKQSFALGLLLLALVFATAEEQRPIDLVVVLDTSSSMHSSYRNVSEYVIGPMLKEFLRVGDTFHLIGFSGAPRAEISRRIEGLGDVETIVGRMLLMYPLDPYSDVISALDYVSRYLSDLPDTRPKTIVFISDGEHSPPPSSTYAGLSPETVKARLAETAARLKGNGWTFRFIRVPFEGEGTLTPLPGTPSTRPAAPSNKAEVASGSKTKDQGSISPKNGQKKPEVATKDGAVGTSAGSSASSTKQGAEAKSNLDVSDAVADLLAAPVVDLSTEDSEASIGATLGAIAVEFPTDIGKTDRSLSIPLSVRNPSPKPVYLETQSVLINGTDRMAKRSFRELGPRSEGTLKIHVTLPSDFPVGQAKIHVEPLFTGSVRISPQSGSVGVDIVEAPFARFFSAALPGLLFALGLAIAALLALLVIVLSRRLSAAPGRAAAAAPLHPRAGSETKTEKEQSRPAIAQTKGANEKPIIPVAQTAKREEDVAYAMPKQEVEIQLQPRAADDTAALLAGFAKRSADDEASRAKIQLAAMESSGLSTPGSVAMPIITPEQERAEKLDRKSVASVVPATFEIRRADTRIMLSLFVEDQNTLIGKRNVHLLKAGTSLSLGGGNSDFLVFLVPLPRRIADIHFDGERCIFIPRKPDFFPDVGQQPVIDCIGKTIRVVSQKGYELKIRLDKFEDPLASLNRFLHQIEVPGK